MTAPLDRSYRALLRVPTLGRVLVSMQIARVAQSMVSVAIVLFTLDRYGSAAFAGLVTFASVFPGLLISPLAGALLDRHGRIRLVLLDYVVALGAMVLIGSLALLDALPGPLLVLIAVVSSLTAILSHVGLRSLFPILVPEHLWERVNAVDSNGYVVAIILGPPAAAALVAFFGGAVALIVIGIAFGIAAFVLVGVPDPPAPTESTGNLLRDAWDGLVYTWNNPTLRGLGFAISSVNLANGMITIVLPLIVLTRFGLDETVVGLVFAASGISGMASALLFGRMDTRGREWSLLVWPAVALIPIMAILLLAAGQAAFVPFGIALLVLQSLLLGVLAGPMDIALFTVRQRRTDPA
ncbi:MAG: MFS transporter, partial [Candidatus Limnocylindria bacterium]